MSGKQVVVYTARDEQDAALLKNALQEAGIAAQVGNAALDSGFGVGAAGWAFLPRVVVSEEDARLARELALEFEHHRDDSEEADENESPAAAVAWPRCDDCQARRTTTCPACQLSGSDFPAADQPADADGEPKILCLCPTCSEPFEPAFLRHCEWCGHDFSDGADQAESAELYEGVNARAALVFFAMAVVAAAAGAYFYFLFD